MKQKRAIYFVISNNIIWSVGLGIINNNIQCAETPAKRLNFLGCEKNSCNFFNLLKKKYYMLSNSTNIN